ncbi:hypothetical protein PV797_19820 [Clostridiaceae bacterium M8S5]|nr:hypothetical protein PV797_19820 [Clostridiaceae bacterium M8S5]
MKNVYYLFKVSIQKSFIQTIRYRFNTLSEILSFYFLFLGMFYGIKMFGVGMNVSKVNLGNTLEGFVVGYFLWTIMIMVYSDTAHGIISDANRGTLEQISMSNARLQNVLVIRSLSNLIVNLIICFIVLICVMETTGYWLDINILLLLPIIIIGIFSMLGIGLIFGGLALIFKKIQSLLNVIQYFLIALVLPSKGSILDSILPFRPTTIGAFKIIMGKQSLLSFSAIDYVLLITNSAVYFVIGIIVFKKCSEIARKRGLLGQY